MIPLSPFVSIICPFLLSGALPLPLLHSLSCVALSILFTFFSHSPPFHRTYSPFEPFVYPLAFAILPSYMLLLFPPWNSSLSLYMYVYISDPTGLTCTLSPPFSCFCFHLNLCLTLTLSNSSSFSFAVQLSLTIPFTLYFEHVLSLSHVKICVPSLSFADTRSTPSSHRCQTYFTTLSVDLLGPLVSLCNINCVLQLFLLGGFREKMFLMTLRQMTITCCP